MDNNEQNLLSLPTLVPPDASADATSWPEDSALSTADIRALPTIDAAVSAAPDKTVDTIPHYAQPEPEPQAATASVPLARSPAASAPAQVSSGREHRDRPTGLLEQYGLNPGVIVGGQHELIRELGRGGMGVVYLARDIRLGRKVAVKFVHLQSPTAKQNFLVEARTTARCTHQNIVLVHGADEFKGLPYMVLEYLPGKTLCQLIDESTDVSGDGTRGLSAARALELMLPVLRALEHAHGMGIVHRDLKPENIIVTDAGVVKVLDFSIATSVRAERSSADPSQSHCAQDEQSGEIVVKSKAGRLVGTVPYMAPEQLNDAPIDHQVDIWAAGIMLYELIAGCHPMAPLSLGVFQRIANVRIPMPRTGDLCPDIGALGPIIDRCLLKDKADRTGSVAEFIAELEPHLPGRRMLSLASDASPFTGLSAFQESDAYRFFGRTEDTLAVVNRVRQQPLVVVIGPSGAGKSSLVLAGVIPTLKRSGEGWQSYIVRPGRAPLLALTEIVDRLEYTAASRIRRKPTGATGSGLATNRDAVNDRLRTEPGYLGSRLRDHAQRQLRRAVLFVDQFEEVYTLCVDEDERAAFLACLAGVADDVVSPLRVVLSMRTDFLERLAENRSFMALATRGLMLLPPMGWAGLRMALEKPLEAAGYRFESQNIVHDMLDGLEGTRSALPLLQFAATTLWKERDRERRLLTEDSYHTMGGIAGTLAKHADAVVASMTVEQQQQARAIFQRLVTPERTRAVVSVDQLRELGRVDAEVVEQVLDKLAEARLVVVDTGTVEIVHESLIDGWPTLRRWLDENQEDAEFLARLRAAAQEWDKSGQSEGMLWRGEPAAEAQRWRQHCAGELSGREQRFLDAVFSLSRRVQRRRRRLIFTGMAVFMLLVLAGVVAITKAQNEAALERSLTQEQAARAAAADAQKEAEQHAEEAEEARARVQSLLTETQGARAREHQLLNQTRADHARIAELLADTQRQRERAEEAEAEALREAVRAQKAQEDEEQARKQAEIAQKKAEALQKKAEEDKEKIAQQNGRIKALLGQLGTQKVDLEARHKQRTKKP